MMPKKRTLPYIILGLLAQNREMNGRQITNQFQNEIGEFWKAAHSQIYPELKKMTAEGLIVKSTKADNDKEIYYSITAAGQAMLMQWIKEPLTDLPVSQDMFSLKMFFIDDKADYELKRLIEEEISLLETQLKHLQEREKLLFGGQEPKKAFGHFLILQRAIARLQSQLDWLKSLNI